MYPQVSKSFINMENLASTVRYSLFFILTQPRNIATVDFCCILNSNVLLIEHVVNWTHWPWPWSHAECLNYCLPCLKK